MKDLTPFQSSFFENMNFSVQADAHATVFINPDQPQNGKIIKYGDQDAFALYIADYTIQNNFELDFKVERGFIRFGLIFEGTSNFRLYNQRQVGFSPTSFLMIENAVSGHQFWEKGTRHVGVEFLIDSNYFESHLVHRFKDLKFVLELQKDYAYYYLPTEVVGTLNELVQRSARDGLSQLHLESALLKCLASITNELETCPENCFANQQKFSTFKIGTQRTSRLTQNDIAAIQKAHQILVDSLHDPPTIHALSKMVFLSEQKLTTGFKKLYHLPIGSYITKQKLQAAANDLMTTDLSIDAISRRIGYAHPSNFSKAFRAQYKKTPLQFRKRHA